MSQFANTPSQNRDIYGLRGSTAAGYHLCCVIFRNQSKLGALIVRYNHKRNEFLLFSIVLRILQLLITLEPRVHSGWVFSKLYLFKEALQSNKKTENVTCLILDWFPQITSQFCNSICLCYCNITDLVAKTLQDLYIRSLRRVSNFRFIIHCNKQDFLHILMQKLLLYMIFLSRDSVLIQGV